jgi:TonB family protein
MSTARLASASLVLCVALAGSAAVAVAAFPLVQAPRDPVPGQLSPEQRVVLQRSVDRAREALVREPAAPDLHHRLAAALWARTVKDPELTDAERIAALREAVTEEDAALRVRPDYLDALRFKSMLLGAVAARTADPAERGRALADASRVDAQASAAEQGASSGDPFAAEVAQLHALKVGAGIRPPTRIHNVHPEYPADARAAGVQGVVVIDCLIDTTGHVASTRVLRSVPALDAAALDAVRQWEYQPVLLNGAPVPVLMTVTVNFTLQ